MKIIEVGTGYTSIPANLGAATEIVVEELSKVFRDNNMNYEIFDIEDENRKETDLKIVDVKVPKIFRKKDVSLGIMHKLKRVIYSINLTLRLKKEIKNSNEKISIHFHNQYNMFFFLKLTSKKMRSKVNLFYTVHSYIWNNEWDKIKKTIRKKYFQEITCVQNADKIFVLNNITVKHFTNFLGINKDKIVLIDNGVNTEIYKPKERNEEKFIFFQSGSVCDRKNQLGAIKALTKTLKENPKSKYLYVGGIISKEYKESIDKYCKDNGIINQVEYGGEIEPGIHLCEYYQKAKAFIFPSNAEAFSLVILEAMSSGLPVIMNRKAILDVSKDLEDTILFYSDDKSFNEILREFIFNEEKRLLISKKSRDLIEKKYSWDVIAKKYIKEFEDVG